MPLLDGLAERVERSFDLLIDIVEILSQTLEGK